MKYSITIPAYKAKYLKEAIDSVLDQSFGDFEVIILNDASPENVKEIVSGYHDSRIRYYENEKNVGAVDVVDNWNRCLELAQGEFLICMGDDDMLLHNCLEIYNKQIECYPDKDIYHGRTYIIDESSKIIDIQEDRPDSESAMSMIWHAFCSKRMQFIGDFLFRTTSLRNVKGFCKLPMARGSDWITAVLVAQQKGIVNGHLPVFSYRVNSQTITTHTQGEILVQADILFREKVLDFIKQSEWKGLDLLYSKILVEKIPQNMYNVMTKTIARDIGFSSFPIKRYIYWRKKRETYHVSSKQYMVIVAYAFLYYLKKVFKIKTM